MSLSIGLSSNTTVILFLLRFFKSFILGTNGDDGGIIPGGGAGIGAGAGALQIQIHTHNYI